MISVIQHGPARRTFEDDEEENARTLSGAQQEVKLSFSGVASVNVAIISSSLHAQAFAHSIIKALALSNVGFVAAADGKSPLLKLYHSTESNVLVAVAPAEIANELALQCVEAISSLSPKQYIVLGGLGISSYVGSGEEGQLLRVTTSAFQEDTSVRRIDTNNIVQGLEAAVIAYAEARNIPAAVFVALTKPYLTVQSMKAFDGVAPLVEQLTGKAVPSPQSSEYAALIKRDPYVLRTENMYS